MKLYDVYPLFNINIVKGKGCKAVSYTHLYIETWGNKHYVTTSGLIVHPNHGSLGERSNLMW